MRALGFRPVVLSLLVLVCACPSGGPSFMPDPDRTKDLPDDAAALVELADRLAGGSLAEKPPSLSKTDRALAALERALRLGHPVPFEVFWRLSRACFLMTEDLEDRDQFHAYARRGVEYAQRALRVNAKRVEGHYFLALNSAKIAEATANSKLIPSMLGPAQAAARIDEKYDDAGPLRYLGKVYLTAPAWPVSVGSPEKAVEVLTRAKALSPVPLNRVFLGEALYHDEEYELAEKELRDALADPRAVRLDGRWQKEAQDYLRKIGAGSPSDPRTSP